MTEHTPTTDEVRKRWAYTLAGDRIHRTDRHFAEFDRWLAEHDLAVRLETLRDAANDLSGYDWAGYEFKAEDALNARADRIEANS